MTRDSATDESLSLDEDVAIVVFTPVFLFAPGFFRNLIFWRAPEAHYRFGFASEVEMRVRSGARSVSNLRAAEK